MATREVTLGKARDFAESGGMFRHRKSAVGDELLGITLALETGVSVVARANKKYGSATISKVFEMPLATSSIQYPAILSDEGITESTREQLSEEIELVIEMTDPISGYLLLYSLQVVSPSDWVWPATAPTPSSIEQNPGRRAELQTGYLYHQVLYSLASDERIALVEQVLRGAEVVEVTVRGERDSAPIRTEIRLS